MKNNKLTIEDIKQWIDNDKSLYKWFKRSKLKIAQFIRVNRLELEDAINRVLNAEPTR